MIYKIKLISKEMVAEGTMAFHFQKPDGFVYQAGQYGDFTLINPPETDDEGDKRTFSLASAPFEPDVKITTRLRDTAFKRTLKNMPEGTEIQFEGPFGSLVLPKDTSKTAVFLTGGIGATLVRSMVAQATHESQANKMVFFYSNSKPENAVFMEEFTRYAQQNPHFTFVPTMTDAGEDWAGQRGFIDLELLKQYIPDITTPIYYLSGPNAMIGDMRRLLLGSDVDRGNIRSDQFIGY